MGEEADTLLSTTSTIATLSKRHSCIIERNVHHTFFVSDHPPGASLEIHQDVCSVEGLEICVVVSEHLRLSEIDVVGGQRISI